MSAPYDWLNRWPEPMPQGDGRAYPERGGSPYVCVDCEWTGGTKSAFDHHMETGHAVRGKHWTASMGNARFSDSDCNGRRVPALQERKSA